MTIEETINLRLKECRNDLAALQQQHELLLKRVQANQVSCHQLTGAISELEGLKRLYGDEGGDSKNSDSDHLRDSANRVDNLRARVGVKPKWEEGGNACF
jgi:hypothetical protein